MDEKVVMMNEPPRNTIRWMCGIEAFVGNFAIKTAYVLRYIRRTCVLVVAMEKQRFPLALFVSFKTGHVVVNHIKYSILCVRILALVLRHADCILLVRRVILPSVACPTVQYFSAISHKRHEFRETIFERKYGLISLQLPFRTILILRRIRRDIIINVCWCSYTISVFFIFKSKLIFLNRLPQNLQMSNFLNFRLVRAEFFHVNRWTDGRTDGRRDMTKQSSSSQYCERTKNRSCQEISHHVWNSTSNT